METAPESHIPVESTWLEIVRPQHPTGPFRAAIFDFDGTLSLLRRNWQDTMIPLMVEILREETSTSESDSQLRECVEEFVMRLNGKQTIYQMLQLGEEVRRRGGTPREALEYKRQYHDRLWTTVSQRIESVASGQVPPERLTVPGARQLLEALTDRGWTLYLASGTDLSYVRNELQVLQLDSFFEPRVYGALDDYRRFSKAQVIQQILSECQVGGDQIVAFGDGFVEIEETQRVGGLAIGVASDEDRRTGINAWKRNRLVQAGAHWIIGDYRQHEQLVQQLRG